MGELGERPAAASQCPSAPISYKDGELTYSFDVAANSNPSGFAFDQRWSKKPGSGPGGRFIQLAGDVIVQAAPSDAEHPITVDLDVKLSHEELAQVINIENKAGSLVFESEPVIRGFEGAEPCISVVATISVATSANISAFEIGTIILPVHLKKSLELTSQNILIHSTSGSVSSETTQLESKKIEVETTSSVITGHFPLYDLLSLKSVSGDVNVDIKPAESDNKEAAGVLVIRTTSGEIEANTDISSIPNRNFTTQVHTVSGTVDGTYLLGSSGNINTVSGSILVDLYAAGDIANRSCIINSVSGTVRSTIHDNSYKLGTLRSNVQSRTGGVDLNLPSAWEGQFHGETKTGSVQITGDGVKIIKDVSPLPGFGRVVIAEKGNGFSYLSVETFSSPISVRVG
jgi:hypothetical protein